MTDDGSLQKKIKDEQSTMGISLLNNIVERNIEYIECFA
jgi:hypothetical protein